MANKKKPWVDENENFGEWDTSVTEPPKEGEMKVAQPDAKKDASQYDDTDFDMLGRLPTSEETAASQPSLPVSAPAPVVVQVTPSPPGERVVERSAYTAVPTAAEMSATGTTIGPTIVVRGKMRCDEHLVVKGRMEAHIKSAKDLRVENTGVVNANIDVHAVSVSGIVVGDIRASELVELTPDARVIGDIMTPRLIIHEGARFRGRIEMDGLQALELVRPVAEVELELEELDDEPLPVRPPLEVPRPGTAPPVRPPPGKGTAPPAEPLNLKPDVRPRETAPAPAPSPPPLGLTPTTRQPAATPAPAPKPSPAPAPPPAAAPTQGGTGAEKGASAGWFGRRSGT